MLSRRERLGRGCVELLYGTVFDERILPQFLAQSRYSQLKKVIASPKQPHSSVRQNKLGYTKSRNRNV